jgi:hypothetical protein
MLKTQQLIMPEIIGFFKKTLNFNSYNNKVTTKSVKLVKKTVYKQVFLKKLLQSIKKQRKLQSQLLLG